MVTETNNEHPETNSKKKSIPTSNIDVSSFDKCTNCYHLSHAVTVLYEC